MPRRQATNAIQMALDEMGIDWHSPRYGRPRKAGAAETIEVPDHGVFGQLLDTMTANGQAGLDARQPPASFRADSWEKAPFWRNAGRFNHVRVRSVMERILGAGETSQVGGTLRTTWRDQAGLISLTSWPNGDRLFDAALAGDRRLPTACLIEIVPGWRRPLSGEDMRVFDAMVVVGRGTQRGVRVLTSSAATDDDISYVREPGHDPAVMDGVVAYDADSGTIVACPGKLMLIPLQRISSFRLETYREGAAAGHSRLLADVTEGSTLTIAEHDETHGLDLVSRSLAKMLNRAIERIDAIAS